MQFLPVLIYGAVVTYWVYAHFFYALQHNPIDDVIKASRPMARLLDYSGVLFGVLVLLSNCATFKVTKENVAKAKEAKAKE